MRTPAPDPALTVNPAAPGDNAGKTVSIFSPDHCPGDGVYWADEAVALKYQREGSRRPQTGSRLKQDAGIHQIDEPIVWGELAGKPVRVLFDTGATFSSIDLDHARSAFGITKESPGAIPAGEANIGSGARIKLYRYVFPEHKISGIRFENVPVMLADFDRSAHVVLGERDEQAPHLFCLQGRRHLRHRGRRRAHASQLRSIVPLK